MNCINCGREMRNTTGGNYACEYCGISINDLVYRPNNYISEPLLNQGWVCPKCGAVMSPYTSHCPFCSQNREIIYGTSTGYYQPNSILMINKTEEKKQ